jgi:3-phenylpropionate/trans-cinnamate dioxygenase ferredoxin reductase component
MVETTIIIGAGHAGAQFVESLRAGGYDGGLVLIGEEPHRPYDRPATSKGLLSGAVELDRIFLKHEAYYKEEGIELQLGTRVVSLDRAERTVTLSNKARLQYDKLVLAPGARPRKLAIPGSELDGVFYLRTAIDSRAISARLGAGCHVAIVGGGYVGLEVAANAIKLGCSVTLVEMQERLLGRVVATEVAEFYDRTHRAVGVKIHYGVEIDRFMGQSSVNGLLLSDGTKIPADLIVVGIGAVPNTELADEAGLPIENGIVVDDFGRTPDPAIFAIGDATNHPNPIIGKRLRLESVPGALGQARAAASHILGNSKPFHELPWFWSDQYDLKLQIAGIAEVGDQVVVRGDPSVRQFAAYYLRKGAIVAVNAISSPKDFIGGRKLILERKVVDCYRLANSAIPLSEV